MNRRDAAALAPFVPSSSFTALLHTTTAGELAEAEAAAVGAAEDLLLTSVPPGASLARVVDAMRDYSLRAVPVHHVDLDAEAPDDRTVCVLVLVCVHVRT